MSDRIPAAGTRPPTPELMRQRAHRASLRIAWFDQVPADLRDVASEGRKLLEFAASDAAEHEVEPVAG